MSCMVRIPEGHGIRYDKQGQHHFYPFLSMEELVSNVQGWGKQVKIIGNGNWITQASKLIEEVGEGAGWLCRGNAIEVKDAVGDKCFLITMVATMLDLDAEAIMGSVAESYGCSGERNNPLLAHTLLHKVNLWLATGIDQALDPAAADSETSKGFIIGSFTAAVAWLREYAEVNEFTLEDAFSMAWDTVKDRKGRLTPEGVFIKMSDAAYFTPAEFLPTEQIDAKMEEVVKNGATVVCLGSVGGSKAFESDSVAMNRISLCANVDGYSLVMPAEAVRDTVYVFVPEDSAMIIAPMSKFIGMANAFSALKPVKEYIVIKEHNA